MLNHLIVREDLLFNMSNFHTNFLQSLRKLAIVFFALFWYDETTMEDNQLLLSLQEMYYVSDFESIY